MRIFAEGELRDFLNGQLDRVRSEIISEDRNKLLNVDELTYIDYLVAKYQVEDLFLDFDSVSVSDREEMISASRFPGSFHIRPGSSYPKQVLTYHLPYSGNNALLRLMPSSRLQWTIEVDLSRSSIDFEIINWRDSAEEIKREADQIQNNIKRQLSSITAEVKAWNSQLDERVRSMVDQRKKTLFVQTDLLEELGVPITRSTDVPSTFAVPIVKKRPVIKKPKTSGEAFSPEPTLVKTTYEEILQICHHMGMEMERHPSVYADKDEESLRDHFLMQLSPHFESVTGETFNRAGKTDILIRHDGGNIFVAECKFWSGIKGMHNAIDQVLSYLTWRDSKTAILLFVRNKGFSTVLETITEGVPDHPCFIKAMGEPRETWFEYRFHLPDDEMRGIDLSILSFHFLPESSAREGRTG